MALWDQALKNEFSQGISAIQLTSKLYVRIKQSVYFHATPSDFFLKIKKLAEGPLLQKWHFRLWNFSQQKLNFYSEKDFENKSENFCKKDSKSGK
jgi:hypothetical protein